MSKSKNLTLGCVLAAIVGCGVLCCGGFGGLMWFGANLYEEEVCAHLDELDGVEETVGRIQSCEFLFMESGEIEDADTFVFLVEGSAANARAYVQSTSTGPGGAEEYQGIALVMGGQEILVEGRMPPTR